MIELIKKIAKLQEVRQGILPMHPEYQYKLDKKFLLEFNYNSNHLEGNTLTHNETELLLIFGRTEGNHTKREYDEMEAHNIAFTKIKEWAADTSRPLTEADIKNLNRIILVKPFWKEAITVDGQQTGRQINIGNYKETPNHVRLTNGEQFYFASVVDTPILMGELIEWYRAEEQKNELEPVALAALLHYKFVRIHPFDDGNGRIARLLMNYVLYRHNLPPVVIKSAEKKDYLAALNSADVGNINSFIEYIAKQLIWSLELSIKAANGESVDEDDDIDKEISLWKRLTSTKTDEILYRNDEIIYQLYSNCIKEMFIQFDNKFKQFDEMFNEKESLICINNRCTNIAYTLYNNTLDDTLLKSKETEQDQKKPQSDSYTNLSIRIMFDSYKYNSNNPSRIRAELKFEFEQQKYKVIFNNAVMIEKSYPEFLNTDERKQIIADSVKSVFEEIKQKSDNNNQL